MIGHAISCTEYQSSGHRLMNDARDLEPGYAHLDRVQRERAAAREFNT